MHKNARRRTAVETELKMMRRLPRFRTTDFSVATVTVTRSATISVRAVLYTVPSRLIGSRLKVHIYDDRLVCWLGTTPLLTLARRFHKLARPSACGRLPPSDRCPGAQAAGVPSIFRDELYPRPVFRRAWEVIDDHLEPASMPGLCWSSCTWPRCMPARRRSLTISSSRPRRGAGSGGRARCRGTVADRHTAGQRRAPDLGGYDQLLGRRRMKEIDAQLPLMLTTLRLPTIGRLWHSFAERADREGWGAAHLAALCEHELAERTTAHCTAPGPIRLPRARRSPPSSSPPSQPCARLMSLALGAGDAWLEQGANILLFGPSGSGKSHVAAAIGHALIDTGRRVLFSRTTDLVQKLQAARRDLALPAAAKLDRYDCLILDDLGYARKDQAETTVLFELIAERYERRSLIVTCNQPFSTWDQIFPDPAMTVAAVDRLVHHATILELNTESYRRRTAVAAARGQTEGDPA